MTSDIIKMNRIIRPTRALDRDLQIRVV